MPQAVDLFKINGAAGLASDLTARRLVKPFESPDAGSPRFDDLLSKASERPAKTDNSSAEDEDSSDAAKRSENDRDRAAAARGKSKTQKSHKSKAGKSTDPSKDAQSKAEKSEETDATATAATDDSPADAAADDDSGEESQSKDAAEKVDPSLVAQNAVQAAQSLAAASQPTAASPKVSVESAKDATDSAAATHAIKSDRPGGNVQKPTVAQQTAGTIGKAAAKTGEDNPQDPDPTATAQAEAPPPLAPKLGIRPVDPQKSDGDANTSTAAAANDSASSTGAPPQDLSTILGDTGLEQLANLFSNFESDSAEAKTAPAKDADAAAPDPSQLITAGYHAAAHEPTVSEVAANAPADVTPEARFAEQNHEKIVNGVRGELLPNGGTMKLRLDPPELGTLQVSLHMRDGVVSASFQTANGDAAQLLSHTLSDLRSTLEAHGITVDKLHVQQSPREESDSGAGKNDSQSRDKTFEQQQDARREQQRKDMVQKLWDRLNGLAPIDLVA